MNKLILIGNLTNDPVQTDTQSGKRVTRFTLAVNRRFQVNGEKVTDFFRINAWNALGDNCYKYLAKGKKAAVTGEIQPRQYENKEGKTVMSLDVSADEVEFLSQKSDDTAEEKPKKEHTYTEADFSDIEDEEVPF